MKKLKCVKSLKMFVKQNVGIGNFMHFIFLHECQNTI